MNIKRLQFTVALGLLSLSVQAATPTPKVAPPDRLRAACMAADGNHDGFVSLNEFHQDVLRSWRSLHPAADGYVSLADLSAIPGMRRGMVERLKRADADGDGKLAFQEVVGARMAYFDAADANNDDQLSMQECIDHQRRLGGAGGKGKK